MRYIRPERVHRGVLNLHDWWGRAQSQGAKHLLPLLALLEVGAGITESVHFEESPNEYEFWDRYFLIREGAAKPYFVPLTRQRAEKGYPHSNAATIRKNRFWRTWGAGTLTQGANGESIWSLSANYSRIFVEKALKKSGVVSRVPVVDLATILFRHDSFESDASAKTLEETFRARFPMHQSDYDRIFLFVDEAEEGLFVSEQPTEDDYIRAIESTIIEEKSVADLAQEESQRHETKLEKDDAVLIEVRELLALGTSGIILAGVPGTSKTWYAHQIAKELVKQPDTHVFRVQFHPSYGYEDFIEGFIPDDSTKSGFRIVDRVFLKACEVATKTQEQVVVVVDEINRGDPARVFGELLTYIETGYRGTPFLLPYSGRPASIPPNLLVIGTMNPADRSIVHLDQALVRRFDHVHLHPSRETLAMFLEGSSSLTKSQIDRMCNWFDEVQKIAPIGHTYFRDATSVERIATIWKYRISPMLGFALEAEEAKLLNVRKMFEKLMVDLSAASDESAASE